MDEIVNRILFRLDELGLDQKTFAKEIGVSPVTITDWKTGKSKSYMKKINIISAALASPLRWLMFGEGPSSKMEEAKISGRLDRLERIATGSWDTPLPNGAELVDFGMFHRIPILGRISAGLPLYAEEHIEGYTLTDLNGGAEYFALIVHGDSMNALGINDGYRIIVRRQDEVENGEVAVVMVGDEDATVKRFYATGSTVTLMPQSTNPEHQPQIYDTSKTTIRVIGRVVKVEFTL